MSWASFNLRPCLPRRFVPDGSDDFQKVLDEFIDDACEETANLNPNLAEFEHCDVNGCGVQNVRDCSEELCKQSTDTPDLTIPPGVIISDCFGNRLSYETEHYDRDVNTQSLRLPGIHSRNNSNNSTNNNNNKTNLCHVTKMGNTCTSKFHTPHEWHSVTKSEWAKSGAKRKVKLLQGRTELEDGISGMSLEQVSPQCTCRYGSHVSVAWPEMLGSPRDSSRFPEELTAALKSSKGLSSGTGSSSERIAFDSPKNEKKSYVGNGGHFRATVKCDVSPHRLTHRTFPPGDRSKHSPHLTFASHPSHPSYKSNSSKQQTDSRNRSQSWSNGRHGTKASLLSPRSQKNSTTGNPKKSKSFSHSASNLSLDDHNPTCPLYQPLIVKNKYKPVSLPMLEIGNNKLDDDDMQPMARRRAASESQRLRPRRLPLTPGEVGHTHVHWADEEMGHALSTSVLLSSIRPRAYSHGAADSMRQRPILKKMSDNNIASQSFS